MSSKSTKGPPVPLQMLVCDAFDSNLLSLENNVKYMMEFLEENKFDGDEWNAVHLLGLLQAVNAITIKIRPKICPDKVGGSCKSAKKISKKK